MVSFTPAKKSRFFWDAGGRSDENMPTTIPAALAFMRLGMMALMSLGFTKMALNFCAMALVTICDSAWVSPLASKVWTSKPNSVPYLRNCFAANACDSLAMLEMTNTAFGLAWAFAPKATPASSVNAMTFSLDMLRLLLVGS